MNASAVPMTPYRGIKEFRYIDEPIFFGRKDELRELLRLIVMYRGVLLFGDSGAGKSSLINAGLLPALVKEQFAPERIRIQPKLGEEFIVERIPSTDDSNGPFLPSLFEGSGRRVTVSARSFAEKVTAADAATCPLLVFDQFEELVTLSEQAVRDGEDPETIERARQGIFTTLMSLLRREDISLKMLFAFREDYYAKLSRFFAGYPNLNDHFFRLEPMHTDDLRAIIRDPFLKSGIEFERPLPDAVMTELEAEFRERTKTDLVSLTEVQIACLRLWNAKDPVALLKSQHVNGLLESYFSEATESIKPVLRPAAVSILVKLVTSSGTRNVVSRDTLLAEMKREKIDWLTATEALEALETTAGVIRREARNDVVIYELVSEFLVSWIMRKKIEARVGEREKKWIRAFAVSCGVGLLIVLVLIAMLYEKSNTELNKSNTELKRTLASEREAHQQRERELRARIDTMNLRHTADKAALGVETERAARHEMLVKQSLAALDNRIETLKKQRAAISPAIEFLANLTSVLDGAARSDHLARLAALRAQDNCMQESMEKARGHIDMLNKGLRSEGRTNRSPVLDPGRLNELR